MELLLFWVLFGVVAAVVASNKGNSGVAWFFVGVLLGPIGLILSLVVSGDPAGVERKKIEDGGYLRCEKCAELIRAEATKCRFCGSDVARSEAAGTPATGAATSSETQANVRETSKYDEFWKTVIFQKSFGAALHSAVDGEVVKIPCFDLRQYGNRPGGWAGTVCVRGDMIVPHSLGATPAHAQSLGNVLTDLAKSWMVLELRPETEFCFTIDKIGETLTVTKGPPPR